MSENNQTKLLIKQGQNADPNKRPSMSLILSVMLKLDSIVNKTPIGPIVAQRSDSIEESILQRTERQFIKTEKYQDFIAANFHDLSLHRSNDYDELLRNQPGRLSYKPPKNMPFHRRSKSYGNEAIAASNNIEKIKAELTNRVETMLYDPVDPMYHDNESIKLFNDHRALIKEDEKLLKSINSLKQQFKQLESTRRNLDTYHELMIQKNKLMKENEKLRKMI